MNTKTIEALNLIENGDITDRELLKHFMKLTGQHIHDHEQLNPHEIYDLIVKQLSQTEPNDNDEPNTFTCPACSADSDALSWNRATESDFGTGITKIEEADEDSMYTCPICFSASPFKNLH